MEYKRFDEKIIIRLDKGEEIMEMIDSICKTEGVNAASVEGIGYTDDMTVRIFDNRKGEFIFKTINEPMEITALTGNVLMADNGLYPHLHIMAADVSTNVRGGHLVKCRIAATAEIILTLLPEKISRGESGDLKLGRLRFDD